jgi:hypothetical protein
LRCRPLVVPSATLLRVSWRAEPCVHAMCVAQLLLSRASRESISLAPPRPACLYSFFCTRSATSFRRRAPTLLRGDTLTVDGPGRSRLLPRCARVPAPSTLFDCCVYFYTRSPEIQPIQLDITPRHSGAILTFTPVNLLLRDCLPFGWRVREEHQPTAIAIGRRDRL